MTARRWMSKREIATAAAAYAALGVVLTCPECGMGPKVYGPYDASAIPPGMDVSLAATYHHRCYHTIGMGRRDFDDYGLESWNRGVLHLGNPPHWLARALFAVASVGWGGVIGEALAFPVAHFLAWLQ